jgi:hypothetical protein
MAMLVTLVDKDGNECLAGSAIEVNDLLASGYRIKGHGTAGAADQPVTRPAAGDSGPAAEPAKATTTVNTDQSGIAVGGGK